MANNSFPTVHNDDVKYLKPASGDGFGYDRINLITIDYAKVEARELALLAESIAGTRKFEKTLDN